MESTEFASQFEQLTGFPPLEWQSRLFEEYFDRARLPNAVDVPTGLGKTALVAIWLIASRAGRALPRRLVYVVDRRAVVDQATTFVEKLRKRLPEDEPLAVSTLRGQHADNREWLDDPTARAIVVGTVDMIGSRLLFEGYGVSRKMRPYHAGLLGADTLVVLDEAHLVGPFEHLLADIEADAGRFGPRSQEGRRLVPGFKLLSLSATGRDRPGETFRFSKQDLGPSDSLSRRRVNARKALRIVDGDPKSTLPAQLADAAWDMSASGQTPMRCLVYCHSRDHAETVAADLSKRLKRTPPSTQPTASAEDCEPKVELFIAARRGWERKAAEQRLQALGFLAGSNREDPRLRFLVATSAGEVGVDLDADHLVCDLVPWERMVQRLGRVNRRGDTDARIVVVDAGPFVPKTADPQETRRIEHAHRCVRELLAALPPIEDGVDASPAALRALKAEGDDARRAALEAATTHPPLRPPLTRALLDAWSMTALREHTGRPEVAPWLRGWIEEEPRTGVIWRDRLPIPDGELDGRSAKATAAWHREIAAYFEAAPPHVTERLETETFRTVDWALARAKQIAEKARKADPNTNGSHDRQTGPLTASAIAAIALDDAGDLSAVFTLSALAEADKRRLQRDLAGKTLVVDARFGGLKGDDIGTLDKAAPDPPAWVADRDGRESETTPAAPATGIRWRVRLLGATDEQPGPEWHPRHELVLKRDGDGEILSRLVVYKLKQDAATEDDRSVGALQTLAEHQAWAAERARAIAQALALPPAFAQALVHAARLHDEGKRSPRWQRAFRAPAHGGPYAKIPRSVNIHMLDGYRHELGSLLHLEQRFEQDAELKAIPPEMRDLILHLIAAHHGGARPTLGVRGCDEAPPSLLADKAREVALRFARLQRQWGPWGLAWWEALLRAADQQASRSNERKKR